VRRQDPGHDAGVTRAARYSTYLFLKEEFERRRDQLRHAGMIADPRDAQIERLKQQVRQLKDRVATLEQDNADLMAFRTRALSRLAAQHEEITRLRTAVSDASNVRPIRGHEEPLADLVAQRDHIIEVPPCDCVQRPRLPAPVLPGPDSSIRTSGSPSRVLTPGCRRGESGAVRRPAVPFAAGRGVGEFLQRRVDDVQVVSRQGGDSAGQPTQFGVDDGAAGPVHQGEEVRLGIV
jgi:hypothetical protein